MSRNCVPASRWAAAAAGLLLYLGLYFGVGLHPAPDARSLATPVDAWIPLCPSAIWVYATVYPSVVAPVLIVRSPARFRRIALSLIGVIVVCAVAFAVFPVETESLRRSAGPGSDLSDGRSFTIWGLELLYALDPPRNAFPSLHVAIATVVALGVGRSLPGGRAGRWLALVWLALVLASVLLVRQHYVVDAVAGLALGVLADRVGVGRGEGGEAPGAFERRGVVQQMLCLLSFYTVLYGVYISGWMPERPLGH